MQKLVRVRWWCALIVFLLLDASRAQAQSLTLAWDANAEPDIGGYLIGYGTSPGHDEQLVDVGGATQWTLQGLMEGTTYYFRVYAYSTQGMRSAPSPDLPATITGGVATEGSSPGGCSTPDPFASLGGGICSGGSWLPPSSGPSTPTPPPSSNGCAGHDPFTSLGGGTCANGGWVPRASGSSNSTPPSPSAPPPSSGGCSGSDPFVSLGGGTCSNGGWLPPGHSGAGGAPQSTSAPTGCSMPDPFKSLGGGTCFEGGWVPPGMSMAHVGHTSPGCVGRDPFVSLGGGTCLSGSWLPPGLVPPASSAFTSTGCVSADPFVGISGLIGLCQNGGWKPVPGVSTTGVVRVFSLSETFWGIAGDDGRVYRPASLESGMQVEGLRVRFQGQVTGQVMIPSPVSLVNIRHIAVR